MQPGEMQFGEMQLSPFIIIFFIYLSIYLLIYTFIYFKINCIIIFYGFNKKFYKPLKINGVLKICILKISEMNHIHKLCKSLLFIYYILIINYFIFYLLFIIKYLLFINKYSLLLLLFIINYLLFNLKILFIIIFLLFIYYCL